MKTTIHSPIKTYEVYRLTDTGTYIYARFHTLEEADACARHENMASDHFTYFVKRT